MNEFFLQTVNRSISASWLVLAVLLLRLVLKKVPKGIFVFLWGFVAIRLLCPFSFESTVSLIPSAETVPLDIATDWTPSIQSGINMVNQAVNPLLNQFIQPEEHGKSLQIVISVCRNIWLLGALVLFLWAEIGDLRLHHRLRTAVLLRENLYQSEYVETPFVLGIFHPTIYLPFKINEVEFDHVVAHEKSHILRKDHWWKPFGFLLLALHWFNPLLWLGYTFFCRDIELACDEKVIRNLDNHQRADYTQSLVSCSANRLVFSSSPLSFGEIGVKKRIRSVMHYRKPTLWMTVLSVTVCLIIAICFLTNPIPVGDHLILMNSSSPTDRNQLSYAIQLGDNALSGEIFVEQWVNGTCTRSSPVVITQYTESITISMRERRENGQQVGTDVQITTNQHDGCLQTYFAYPEEQTIIGWAFTGYEKDEIVKLSPNRDVILAAKAFDSGRGVRVFDCETLVTKSEHLQNASNMIVVRAIFSTDSLDMADHKETSLPVEIRSE